MSQSSKSFPELLKIGPHVMAFPLVHGSGDFAWEIRRAMMQYDFDCVAVPIPESFRPDVEKGILKLPVPSVVVQKSDFVTQYSPDDSEDDDSGSISYVPIDPCQGVIAALRVAMEEHIPRKFIDLETDPFEPHSVGLPDAYALKKVPLETFVASMVPTLPPPASQQAHDRIAHMAARLRELEDDFQFDQALQEP